MKTSNIFISNFLSLVARIPRPPPHHSADRCLKQSYKVSKQCQISGSVLWNQLETKQPTLKDNQTFHNYYSRRQLHFITKKLESNCKMLLFKLVKTEHFNVKVCNRMLHFQINKFECGWGNCTYWVQWWRWWACCRWTSSCSRWWRAACPPSCTSPGPSWSGAGVGGGRDQFWRFGGHGFKR